MWLFVHRPFEVWPSIAPFRIELVYISLVSVFWLFQPKSITFSRSHIPVVVLAVTYLIASQTSPYATILSIENWLKVCVFYALLSTTSLNIRQFKTLIIGFVFVMAIYELHSLSEYFNGRGAARMGVWRMVGVDRSYGDPNSFGASICYGLPFLYPLWTIAGQRWQKTGLVAIAVLGVSCILFTGSRSAFAALLVLLLLFVMTSRFRWRLLLTASILAVIVWASLREDLRNRYFTLIDSSQGPVNAQKSAEGRGKSFAYGMQSFAEDPIFGAGLGSYREIHGFATHNLYNEAMGELGIFGLIVLVGFAWAFIFDTFEAFNNVKRSDDKDDIFLYRVCLASLVACGTLYLLGWGAHNLSRYNWLWNGAFSGMAIAIIRRDKVSPRLENQQVDAGAGGCPS